MQYDILAKWPPCEMLYIVSMRFITESAMRSAEAVTTAIDRARADFSYTDPEPTLNHLQNILAMGAALSRYFWPVRAGHENRGKILRRSFNVTDSSPLKSRDVRNEIEHFDEKLDIYLSKGVVGVIVAHYVGPSPKSSQVPSHFFRAYYTDRDVFEVLGKRFTIQPLVAEIARIHILLGESQRSGGRLPGKCSGGKLPRAQR
jgi:hypothetical protein